MSFFRSIIFFFLLLQSVFFDAYGQQKKLLDSIAEKIEWVGLQKRSSTLFVHFDKNIYSNSESVWFTAYITKTNTINLHHTLAVALVRNDDRSVLAAGKYVMEREMAFGNLFLPDSLPTGNYSLVCYTNQLVNGYPAALFVQPITIRSNDAAGFIAKLSLTDSIKPGMDSVSVLIKAYTKDVTLVKGGLVKYFIGDREHPLRSGSLKTDNFGEATINIPLKLITPANNMLQTEIYNGREIKNFSLKLPVYKIDTLVKFYPEGGYLINGAPNTVGWEVKNNEGEPLLVDAALYQNDQLLQKIRTNGYGMGKFVFTPAPGSTYAIKISGTASDKPFLLPATISNGPVISLTNALCSDTVIISAIDQRTEQTLMVYIHDYRTVFIAAPVVTAVKNMVIKIPLTEVPKGIVTLTILDSLGRPLAERLLFAHFNDKANIAISTDTLSYASRQTVNVKLKITGADQRPLKGLVSIACVQNSRIDLKRQQNIESYTFLTEALSDLPFKKDILSDDSANKEFLELLLLIKGWRKYTWQQVENIKVTDTMAAISSMVFKGKVMLRQKILKRPVMLNLKAYITPKFAKLAIVKTDSTGNFELLPAAIQTAPNNKLELSVRNDNQFEYTINVNDPYKEMNKKLAATLFFRDYNQRGFAQNSQQFIFKNDEVAKTLKAVTVIAKKDNRWYGAPGANICGDYVCLYNILNCTNHMNYGYQPVVGASYITRQFGSSTTSRIVYTGCQDLDLQAKKEYLFSMEGIYSAKEFYATDLSKADLSDPQYLSTLYWNYSLLTDKNGEATFHFSTSDISGKFKIIVQGVTSANLVYGEQQFEVREQ